MLETPLWERSFSQFKWGLFSSLLPLTAAEKYNEGIKVESGDKGRIFPLFTEMQKNRPKKKIPARPSRFWCDVYYWYPAKSMRKTKHLYLFETVYAISPLENWGNLDVVRFWRRIFPLSFLPDNPLPFAGKMNLKRVFSSLSKDTAREKTSTNVPPPKYFRRKKKEEYSHPHCQTRIFPPIFVSPQHSTPFCSKKTLKKSCRRNFCNLKRGFFGDFVWDLSLASLKVLDLWPPPLSFLHFPLLTDPTKACHYPKEGEEKKEGFE